jgi:ribonuclease Z
MASRMVEKRVGTVLLQGFSLAGEESVVAVPEMNLAFDVGRAPREIISLETICLTHGHMDHAAGIAYYFSQRNFQDQTPGTALVPHKMIPAINDLMQVWGRIEGHVSPYKLVGVDEDEDHELNRQLIVRPFRVRHAQPALGFSVIEVRKKLKPEYAEFSGQQIAAAKRKGETVEYRLEVPKVCYCGDSMVGPFLDHEHVRNADVLIVECTFYEPDHVERARQGQHTHVQDMPALYERVRSPHVVITHTTRRTGIGGAKHALRKILSKADWDRTTLLMDLPRERRTPTRDEDRDAEIG